MHLKLSKLPAPGTSASLIRFVPPTFSKSRRRNRCSLAIDEFGEIICPIGDIPLLGNTSTRSSKDNKNNMGRGVFLPDTWHTITIFVNVSAGTLQIAIDGIHSYSFENVNSNDLQLRNKIILFGGGEKGQSRGGNLRLLTIDAGKALRANEFKDSLLKNLAGEIILLNREDELKDLSFVSKTLVSYGYNISQVESNENALAYINKIFQPAISCILTFNPNDAENKELIRQIRAAPKEYKNIVLVQIKDSKESKVIKKPTAATTKILSFEDLQAAGLCTVTEPSNSKINVGDEVYAKASYRGRKQEVPGTILAVYKDGKYRIKYNSSRYGGIKIIGKEDIRVDEASNLLVVTVEWKYILDVLPTIASYTSKMKWVSEAIIVDNDLDDY